MNIWQRAALAFVFVWFFFGGIAHFLYDDFFVSIVPPGIKSPEMVVYVTGLLEIIGAICILSSTLRRIAGLGLFALTLLVTPANLHMWMNFDQFPDYSPTLLGFRLVIQVFLLALILWATQQPRAPQVRTA